MRKPSPALVISCFALFVALGGTAIAARNHYLITSVNQISPQARKALRGPAGPAGANGAAGKNGSNGTNGTNGNNGNPGINGSARAFAEVNATGSFFGNGKNVGAAKRASEGVYCVSFGGGIAPSNSIIVALPIYTGNRVYLQMHNDGGDCESGQFQIDAHNGEGNLKDSAFEVMVP